MFKKRPPVWKRKIVLLINCIIAVCSVVLSFFYIFNRRVDELKQKNYKLSEAEQKSHTVNNLSETGETYMAAFSSGIYVIGVHIPEGTYTIKLQGKHSYLLLEDMGNSIYVEKNFKKSKENNDTYAKNLYCYSGAKLYIQGDSLEFYSENAQIHDMSGIENPQKATLELQMDSIAGKDFPIGTYNIAIEDSSCPGVTIIIPKLPDMEFSDKVQLDLKSNIGIFHNIYMPSGTKILLKDKSNSQISLIPSDTIPENYKGYYHMFQKK